MAGGCLWTGEEEQILRRWLPVLGKEEFVARGLLNRTQGAIESRAKILGIKSRCADCVVEIDPYAARCRSCRAKARWKCGDLGGEEHRRKLSEAMKRRWKCGNMDGIFDEERNRKLSEAIKLKWVRGDYDGVFDHFSDEEHRRKLSDAAKVRWEQGVYDGVFQSPTSIELQVAAALDIMGIEHESQYRPDGYSRIFDEFIPPDLLIEVHGDYWHGSDFPEHQQRDIEKAQWAEEHGFRLTVLWEHEIHKVGAWSLVTERIGMNLQGGERCR